MFVIDSGIIDMKNYIFKNSETDIPACLRIALKVPRVYRQDGLGLLYKGLYLNSTKFHGYQQLVVEN
jgi:hypothetical protein